MKKSLLSVLSDQNSRSIIVDLILIDNRLLFILPRGTGNDLHVLYQSYYDQIDWLCSLGSYTLDYAGLIVETKQLSRSLINPMQWRSCLEGMLPIVWQLRLA